ncbi:hypothetical protein NEFER03_1107 [Nematocida sp. LUAm3]|nr:hypothetical protein NEFER03_1107 [Nematocida sp. LUAm3]
MLLVIYALALFFYIENIFASEYKHAIEEIYLFKKERQELLEAAKRRYTYLVIAPLIYLNPRRIILPNTKYADIKDRKEKEDMDSNVSSFICNLCIIFIKHPTEKEFNKAFQYIINADFYNQNYKEPITNVVMKVFKKYKENRQNVTTYKDFLNRIMHEIIIVEKIPQNYVKKLIPKLMSIRTIIRQTNKIRYHNKTLLPSEGKELLWLVDRIDILLAYYICIYNMEDGIEDIVKFQKDFGESIAARFTTQESTRSIILPNILEKKKLLNICMGLTIKDKKYFDFIKKKYGLETTGEFYIYYYFNNNIVCNWSNYEEVKKIEEISRKLEKKKEQEEEQQLKDQEKSGNIENITKTYKALQANPQKENFQGENHLENINHLPFKSNRITKPYTFHPRVTQWGINDLDRIQENLNKYADPLYRMQSTNRLLLAKYLHDIFPVIRIFSSEYSNQFFSENKTSFKGYSYTAEGAMIIKERKEDPEKTVITGQVEIGVDKEKKTRIYHLYFKPISETIDYSSEKKVDIQNIGYGEKCAMCKEYFFFSESSIYAAEFIGKEEKGDIIIIFPNIDIDDHPAVERTLFLKRKTNLGVSVDTNKNKKNRKQTSQRT